MSYVSYLVSTPYIYGMKYWILLAVVVLSASCMQLGDKKPLKDLKQIRAAEFQRLDSLANSPKVEDFFEGFTGDTMVQLKHIDFPVHYIHFNVDGKPFFQMDLLPEDWQFQSFEWDPSVATRKTKSYTQELVQPAPDSAVLQLRGTGETRVFSDFIFQRDSVWRLTKWYDLTN